MDLPQTIQSLPLTSGVYIMKDKDGRVIYVGKAISLRKRVQSYFRKDTGSFKTDLLVAVIDAIEHIDTASEAEALLLEANLIKEHQPKYNIVLKDGKSYPHIQVTKEKFPLISIVRMTSKKAQDVKAEYYGPYTSPALIREALNIIRKIFHSRSCETLPNKPCLDYHIGLCDAPCINNISEAEYKRNIRHVCLILQGKKDELLKSLHEDMARYVQDKNFECAAKVRDQIRAIGALYSSNKDINYFKEAEQLERALGLPKTPARIECFDISNIMGNQSVGSMVSFLNGKPDKSNYRRFKIRQVEGIDDFKMMAEVVRRRYTRLKNEGLIFPDLIIIDGGKGQLSAAADELNKLEVQIPMISLAKREEEVFMPGRRNSIILAKDSLGLRLLQRVRDEAHRFAVKYHRLLRGKKVFGIETP
jgi:excinuclease ABC subunit C